MDQRTLLDSGLIMAVRVAVIAALSLAFAVFGGCGGGGIDTSTPTAVGSGAGTSQSTTGQPAAGNTSGGAQQGSDGSGAASGVVDQPAAGNTPENAQRPTNPARGEAQTPAPVQPQPPAAEAPTSPENPPVTAPTPTSGAFPILCKRAHGDGAVVKGGQLRWDRAYVEVDGRSFDLSAADETRGEPNNAGYNNPEIVEIRGRDYDNKAMVMGFGRDGRPRSLSVYDFAGVSQWDCSVGIMATVGDELAQCYFAMGSFNQGFGPPTYAGFFRSSGELIRWDMAEGRIETTARELPFDAAGNMNAQCGVAR